MLSPVFSEHTSPTRLMCGKQRLCFHFLCTVEISCLNKLRLGRNCLWHHIILGMKACLIKLPWHLEDNTPYCLLVKFMLFFNQAMLHVLIHTSNTSRWIWIRVSLDHLVTQKWNDVTDFYKAPNCSLLLCQLVHLNLFLLHCIVGMCPIFHYVTLFVYLSPYSICPLSAFLSARLNE